MYVEATKKRYPDFLNWEELKEIKKYGDIEFHSYSHKKLNYLQKEEIEKDFKKGIEIFKKNLGFRPTLFSYPYGNFDKKLIEITKKFGFKAAFTQFNLSAVSTKENLFLIPRSGFFSKFKMVVKLKSLKVKLIEPNSFYIKKLNWVKVKFLENVKKAEVFISGFGWRKMEIENNIGKVFIGKKLKKEKTIIVIKSGNKVRNFLVYLQKNR